MLLNVFLYTENGNSEEQPKLSSHQQDQNYEDHPSNNQAGDPNVSRNQEVYLTQVSEEIQGTVIRKLSKEFTRTESHIFGTLSKPVEFVPIPRVRVHSKHVPETSRNSNGGKQETNKDCSWNDSHRNVGVPLSQSSRKFNPNETSYMVTRVYEGISYCSFRTSSSEQK